MPDQRILDRIAAWQESGILDAPTADRLRALEANSPSEPATATELPRASASAGLSSLGLDLDLGEAFAYLGSFFLLGAWYWFINQAAVGQASADGTWAFGLAVPAVVFASLGLVLGRRTGKVGRSAGFWLLMSGIHVLFAVPFIAGLLLGASASSESGLSAYRWLFGSVAWLLAALAFRRYLASLPTQLGVLGAIATLTATGVDRVARLITGPPSFTDAGVPNGDPYAITWMFVTLAGTVVATVAMGLLARVEAARVDPAARRRLAVTRFAGGMTLTIGAAIAVLSGVGGGLGRPMEPILGEVVLLLVATILAWLAFTRQAGAYIYPAGLAVLIAFSDLNGAYVAPESGMGLALLLEGAALIGVGYLTEIGRRRLNRRGPTTPSAASGEILPGPSEMPSS